MLVPPAAEQLKFDRVLVGWKDTREARRAIADSLPLLQAARHVVVVAPAERLAETRKLERANDALRDHRNGRFEGAAVLVP